MKRGDRLLLIASLIILLFLAARIAVGSVNNELFFPTFPTANCEPKKALAWAFLGSTTNAPNELGLCPDAYYLHWGPSPAENTTLTHVPMLWGDWPQTVETFLEVIPPAYEGIVLGPNEPDRVDQSNMTPQETAALMRYVEDLRPGILWVGPSYSNASSDCLKLIQWWGQYIGQGGDPDRIVAWGYHIYPDPRFMSAAEKVNECYSNIQEASLPYRPLWVTEIGHTVCNQAGADEYREWVEQLLVDGRVEQVFGFAPWTNGSPFCPFLTQGLELTAIGTAYRNANRVTAYP